MIKRVETEFNKQVNNVKNMLESLGYHKALKAMNFAMQYHKGMRKDGESHEFSHQLFIVEYLLTIAPSLIDPDTTITVAILHDLLEDYDVPKKIIIDLFGDEVLASVQRLNKYREDGTPKTMREYFDEMTCIHSALVKGCDRSHNVYSMPATDWPIDKMDEYVALAEDYVLPTLKRSRKMYPEQRQAYENLKKMLLVQIYPMKLWLHQLRRASTNELSMTP